MLLVELISGLLIYAGIWFATIRALRATRSRPSYLIAWSAVLATCTVWLTILFAIYGRGILQLFADVIRHPNEDFWGQKMIGLFLAFLFAGPTPIAVACLCATPANRWFTRRTPRIACLLASTTLIFLYITYHRVAILRIQDQFGQPVPEVKVTYYVDGRRTQSTKSNGELKIGYYRGVNRIDVADAVAEGYIVDYRLCSHRPYDPFHRNLSFQLGRFFALPSYFTPSLMRTSSPMADLTT